MTTFPLGLPAPPGEILRARYQDRLPGKLEDLAGPQHGVVQLPLHVAWSGLTAFDLDRPKLRLSMYHLVLHEGQRYDIAAYLNRELLISSWPILRTLVSRTIRNVWEAAFPELNERQAATP
jgi:hypothetical protein